MKKTVATRLDDETREWLDGQARKLEVSQSAVLERIVLEARSVGAAPAKASPRAERVPSPSETGTEHWREPTAEEVEDTRERFRREYPKREMLPRERLMRLARAEARARDQGRLPRVGEVVGRDTPRPVEANGAKGQVRESASFDRLTFKRAAFFRGLDTKPPDGVTHGKGDKPRGAERPPAA